MTGFNAIGAGALGTSGGAWTNKAAVSATAACTAIGIKLASSSSAVSSSPSVVASGFIPAQTETGSATISGAGVVSAVGYKVFVPAVSNYLIGQSYLAELTGDADGLESVMLPVSNVRVRLKSGKESYLQIAIPYTTVYAAQCTARTNGDIRLFHRALYNGGFVQTTATEVKFETIQISRGVAASSIILVGHRQTTNSTPQSHAINPKSLQTGTSKTNMITPDFDPKIKAGDDATAEETTYTIGTVSLDVQITANALTVQNQYIEA